jgi:hypothetical protein
MIASLYITGARIDRVRVLGSAYWALTDVGCRDASGEC